MTTVSCPLPYRQFNFLQVIESKEICVPFITKRGKVVPALNWIPHHKFIWGNGGTVSSTHS